MPIDASKVTWDAPEASTEPQSSDAPKVRWDKPKAPAATGIDAAAVEWDSAPAPAATAERAPRTLASPAQPDFGNVRTDVTSTEAMPARPKPGFGRTLGDAVERGAASAIASTAHTVTDFIDQTVQAPLRGLGKAAADAFHITADPDVARELGDPLGVRAEAATNLAIEGTINADRQASSERIGARPTLAELKENPGEAVHRQALRLTDAAGESLPLLAAAVATRNPQLGSALMGGTTAAQTFTDLRGEGLDRGEAARAAALTGAVEAAGEGIGLGAILKPSRPGSLVRAAVAEGAQEVPVSIAQTNIRDQATGRTTSIEDQLLDALEAGAVGGVLGAGGHVVGAGRQPAADATSAPAANPEAAAMRAEADRMSTGGPLSRAAGDVLHARADQIEQLRPVAEPGGMAAAAEVLPQKPMGAAASALPRRSATDATAVIDQHVAALQAAAGDGLLGEQQLADTNSERAQLDSTIRNHLRRREQGLVTADPAGERELAAQLPQLEQRRAELDRSLERHKLAAGRGVQLQRLQERLGRIDRDADLVDLADRISPPAGPSIALPGSDEVAPETLENANKSQQIPTPSDPLAREVAGQDRGETGLNISQHFATSNATPSAVGAAAAEAATSPENDLQTPSPAQIEAGNYRVGRLRVNGLDISIEHPAGVKRKPEHSQALAHPYGSIRRTEGADGDKVDVFLGDRADDTRLPVFVVDQTKPDGSFDESKVMLGFESEQAARAAYLANYPKDWNGLSDVRQFTQREFKVWVQDPAATQRPAMTAGLELDRAQRLAERFTTGWGPGAPRVVLARNPGELRKAAGLPADAEVADRAEGSWHGKPAVFLNLAAIDTPQRMRQVIAHEALGHFAVDEVVGKDWPAIEQAVAGHVLNGTGGKSVRIAIETLRRSQPQALAQPNTAAREVLAVMAEQGASNALVTRVMAGLRRKLRKVAPSLKLSDAELRDLLRRGDGVLRRGGTATSKASIDARAGAIDPAGVQWDEAAPGAAASDVAPQPLTREDGATYGNPRPLPNRPERRDGVAEPGAEAGQGTATAVSGIDVFLTPGKDGRPAAGTTRLLQKAQVARTGTFRSGIAKVATLADAAHVLAPLRKSAQERFLVLGLDADGRPLAVLQHSVGTIDGAEVRPGTVFGAIAAVPGVKSVVFAHNHPSANPTPSAADMAVDRTLGELFRGSGIDVRGAIILQPGRKTFTSYNSAGETGESQGKITPARRSGVVPVVERALRKIQPPGGRTTIDSWQTAEATVKALRGKHTAGVVLLNTRHDVVGHMPFDPIATEALRTGDPATSHAKYIRAAVEANANAAIVYGDKLFEPGIQNMAAALKAAEIRPLDAFLFDGDTTESQAKLGHSIGSGTFYSVATEPEPPAPPDVSRIAPTFEHLDAGQRAALGKIDTHNTIRESLKGKVRRLTDRWQAKTIQGLFDQFAPLKELDETGYMQARLSKGIDGAVEAVFRFGPPKLTDGALDVRRDGKGLQGVLQDLKGEHDLFLAWVAGNRAERLADEGREHLFSAEEIGSLKRLHLGKMPDGRDRREVYDIAQRALARYNRAVLDVSEAAGILNPDDRAQWEHDVYVPFFRVSEDPSGGMSGLVRQQAIERLKGGAEPLGDLLSNVLGNWHQLLSASMKNMAASRALSAAVDLDVATPVQEGGKGTVWIARKGEKVHYQVHDPLILDALTMLHLQPWNNAAMKTMGWFKRALTIGVTADPAFRIRNLMRDTVSVIAANRIGWNPLRNLAQGWRASATGTDTYVALVGGGGAIRFGSLLDGDQAANAKRLIASGIAKEGDILDTSAKAKAVLGRAWNWWKEVGDRAETVNRAALYEQARASGMDHLQASFAARDTLDFTMHGKWAAVRFLTQTVPFFNARLQGLHKLGRGAKADPRRFMAVTGAVALASALLYLANRDDEDFQALPDWVRDTYWWVRLPGTNRALFIPKPFEVGALGSVVERGTEVMLGGEDYKSADFIDTLRSILTNQLAMNPIPQIFRPAQEAAFNWNAFQDRPIDSMGQERLPAEDRYTARTSAGAIGAGKVTGISPQRIEHLVRGYFGWLGTQALAVSDMVGRGVFDMPSNPAHDFTRPENIAVVGAFIRPTDGSGSKYVNRYFKDLDAVQQLYAAWSSARKAGEYERAEELYKDDRLRLRGLYSAADKQMRSINQRVRRVTADRTLSAEAKGELLAGLYGQRNRLAKRTTDQARARQAREDERQASRQGTQ